MTADVEQEYPFLSPVVEVQLAGFDARAQSRIVAAGRQLWDEQGWCFTGGEFSLPVDSVVACARELPWPCARGELWERLLEVSER